MHDVVYEDVCIRNTKNPILMDTNYSYYGKDRDKLPTFNDIVLRNVRVTGGGKISLEGLDATHRLGIAFDNVLLDDPAAFQFSAKYADVTLGPGPANFHASGNDVKVSGTPGTGPAQACGEKFVPFPLK